MMIIMNLVFAYGSLINRTELEKTLKEENAEKDYLVAGVGRIEDYRLAFTRYSKKWKGGVLDVITSPSDYVLGLVLKVSNRGLEAIDRREGVHSGAYARETVSVNVEGKSLEATMYIVVNKDLTNILPSKEYVNKVVVAMRDKEFPESYILKYLY
jgi:cation transport regulator ChaC